MTEWRDTTLGGVITLQRGFDLTEKQATPGPFPVISSGGAAYTTDVARVDGPGVITGRKGVLGKVHYSSGPYWPHDTTLWVKDFKGSDPRFIYYLLQTLPLVSLDAGASNPTLNRNHAHLLPVSVPPPSTQIRVSAVLGALDDLIENNRRRVEVLEEMARAIYREWFVRMRYPGQSDDGGIADETLPDGWELVPLVEVAEITMGQSPRSEFYNEDGDGLPFHQGVTHFGRHYPTHRKWCAVDGRTALEGDVLVSVRAPVGRLNLADTTLVIGRGLAAVRSRRGHQCLLHANLKEVFAEEDSMGGGTIFKAIGKSELEQVRVLRVPEPLAERAEDDLRAKANLIGALIFANRQLVTLRDLLLPKLVTGQIDVSSLDLDALVEDSVA